MTRERILTLSLLPFMLMSSAVYARSVSGKKRLQTGTYYGAYGSRPYWQGEPTDRLPICDTVATRATIRITAFVRIDPGSVGPRADDIARALTTAWYLCAQEPRTTRLSIATFAIR
jgi:hypothetical protein